MRCAFGGDAGRTRVAMAGTARGSGGRRRRGARVVVMKGVIRKTFSYKGDSSNGDERVIRKSFTYMDGHCTWATF
ncbi:unnamed protein product [Urochloa humidicola]